MSSEEREKHIQEKRAWIASRRAELDQFEKQFEMQYGNKHPRVNWMRYRDLEAWKFELEIEEWELEQFIANSEDEGWPTS